MKLYADAEGRRFLQILGDLLVMGWLYLWVQLGYVVHDTTMLLARPAEELARAGGGLAESLREAGRRVGGIPLVGDEIRAPFENAGGAADRIAAAGAAQVEAVTTLAVWLGLSVGAIPILVVLAVYAPLRWRFVREATAGSRILKCSDGLDLFALRALSRQPLHELARISDDPAGAWRRGDVATVRALASLELRGSGLAVPRSVRER